MISHPRGDDSRMAGRGGTTGPPDEHADDRPAAQVLADRVAAALIHHEPGWRLPRRSALARRYGVSPAEMEAAIEELSARHLLRRLPDGQVYRASPADYLIRLEGLPDLQASIDPMGMAITCASRHVSWRRVPEDIGGALGLPPGDPVCVVRCLWASGGWPAAFSASYLPEQHSFLAEDAPAFTDVLKASQVVPGSAAQAPPGGAGQQAPPGGAGQQAPPGEAGRPAPRPAGLYIEMQPPAPSVARSLRLAAGQSAISVTVRFDDESDGSPVALAIAVLRPEMFRVVVQSPHGPRAGAAVAGDDGIWTHAAGGWEP
jgi:DNA-binding GntR family transcriptional regulator